MLLDLHVAVSHLPVHQGPQVDAGFFRHRHDSQEREPQPEGLLGALRRHPVGRLPLRIGPQYSEAVGYPVLASPVGEGDGEGSGGSAEVDCLMGLIRVSTTA
jgi:hypothetical protein